MEEAWELAVVSDDFDPNTIFSDEGLEFIKMNEFAIRYHLIRLSNHIHEFTENYEFLKSIGLGSEIKMPLSHEIWDVVIECAEALSGIANILSPSRRGKKGDLCVQLTKKRSEAIQGLMLLKITDRTDLVDFRNRIHHEDEDFDDWYFRKMTKAPAHSPEVVRRYITWGFSPVTSDATAFASAYDAKSGYVHFYDNHYNLHEAKKWVDAINDNIPAAHQRLTELSGTTTEVTVS